MLTHRNFKYFYLHFKTDDRNPESAHFIDKLQLSKKILPDKNLNLRPGNTQILQLYNIEDFGLRLMKIIINYLL